MMPIPATDFALIGHQESWARLERVLRALRAPGLEMLEPSVVRELVPWIPPRVVLRLTITSAFADISVGGVYIDTFITPDELASGGHARLLAKTRDAIACAQREGVRIASLGGFTSIILEGSKLQPEHSGAVVLTTGNSLTVAYIVKGVERATQLLGRKLAQSNLLIIGATGDVGSGCVRYFAGRVKSLLLVARNVARLRALEEEVRGAGLAVRADRDVSALLASADIVIAAAAVSAPTFDLGGCRPDVLVCDAGYPKNLVPSKGASGHWFWGGMGQVLGGWSAEGPLHDFYEFPAPRVAHGCMLEGVALALEGRIEPYSAGRGNITTARIEEMWAIAERHGLALAPFFNHTGLWPRQPVAPAHCFAAEGA